jgi:stearoyl-CoA desaturase (delta-9 desaturase)
LIFPAISLKIGRESGIALIPGGNCASLFRAFAIIRAFAIWGIGLLSNPENRRLAIHRKDERKIMGWTVFAIGGIHLAALLALNPAYYSRSGLVLGIVLYFVAGMLGVTLCFHRLLTHRSFQTYKWMEYFLTFCGVLALQSGPMQWVAQHRIHHKEADDEPDPHSPLVTFLWAHMGWLFVTVPGCHAYEDYSRFAKDLARDPVQRFFARYFFQIWAGFAVLVYLAGELYGGLGMSWLVWGVLVRQVLLWHATWLVNSATHLWGYRNYKTDEESTNNWWVALFAFGEGWHNNHHADQRSAAHGQRWFEIDITYMLIRLMGLTGLAWSINEPSKRIVAKRVDIMVDDEAIRVSDEMNSRAAGHVLQTQTDPTIPVQVPQMPSAAEAYEAALRAAGEAKEAAAKALQYAAQAIAHKQQGAVEKADHAVKELLERAKDLGMAAVEQAKFAAAQAHEFSSQAGQYAADAKERAAESARQFAEKSRALAQEAFEAATRAADEVSEAFQGIGRPIITSTI